MAALCSYDDRRGYGKLFSEHVTQAHQGFDFLARTDEPVPEPEIH